MEAAVLAVLAAAGAALAAGAGARARAQGRTRLARLAPRTLPTRAGPCAVAMAGAGPPVLVLHGAGGGFDQGLALGAPLVAAGYRVIAPSRFGYPGTPRPREAGAAAQAAALDDVLGALGVGRVAVVGASAGAAPALAFAAANPARTAALALVVPVTAVPGAPPRAAMRPWQEALARRIAASDAAYAALRLAAPGWVRGALFGTPASLIRAADPAERARAEAFVAALPPLADRAAGMRNDADATLRPGHAPPPGVPLFLAATEDDPYGSAAVARSLARDGAALHLHPTGAHLCVGCTPAIFAALAAFLARALGAGVRSPVPPSSS